MPFPERSPFYGIEFTPASKPKIETELVRPASTEVRLNDLYEELKDLRSWIERNEHWFESSDGWELEFVEELKDRVSRLIP